MHDRRCNMRRGLVVLVVAVSLIISIPIFSFAQNYPTKPIHMIITFPPGGSVDPSTRALVEGAKKFLDQPIIIENRAGGGGTVGLAEAVNEKPDGYHVVSFVISSYTRIPHLRPVPYKLGDIVPIMQFAQVPSGVAVQADSPWKTFKELVDYARKNPKKVTYSTMGANTPQEISMQLIARKEGISWIHVPYKGTAPAIAALLGRNVDFTCVSTDFIPHVKAGTLRVLAILDQQRLDDFPEIPTFRELGYDFLNEYITDVGFFVGAPKGTPPFALEKLDDVLHKGMEDPMFVQTLKNMQLRPFYRGHKELPAYLKRMYDDFGKVVKELNLKVDK
jgi:tripartite-type tricarboxylate transporter receptor subunit TctC